MKIVDYSLALLPQDAADMLTDAQTLMNYGKYQIPVVSALPNWTGSLGEFAVYAAGNTWALVMCTSDQTTRWSAMSNFFP